MFSDHFLKINGYKICPLQFLCKPSFNVMVSLKRWSYSSDFSSIFTVAASLYRYADVINEPIKICLLDDYMIEY